MERKLTNILHEYKSTEMITAHCVELKKQNEETDKQIRTHTNNNGNGGSSGTEKKLNLSDKFMKSHLRTKITTHHKSIGMNCYWMLLCCFVHLQKSCCFLCLHGAHWASDRNEDRLLLFNGHPEHELDLDDFRCNFSTKSLQIASKTFSFVIANSRPKIPTADWIVFLTLVVNLMLCVCCLLHTKNHSIDGLFIPFAECFSRKSLIPSIIASSAKNEMLNTFDVDAFFATISDSVFFSISLRSVYPVWTPKFNQGNET